MAVPREIHIQLRVLGMLGRQSVGEVLAEAVAHEVDRRGLEGVMQPLVDEMHSRMDAAEGTE
jgi:hypothetical protein